MGDVISGAMPDSGAPTCSEGTYTGTLVGLELKSQKRLCG